MAGSTLRVLTYHRVADPRPNEHLAPFLVTASPAEFERQLRFLTTHYHPVGAADVIAAITNASSLPTRAVLVTFDDGYHDFLDHAWPLLKQYRVPVVLFAISAFASDGSNLLWWDRVWQSVARSASHSVDIPGLRQYSLESIEQRLRAADEIIDWLKTLDPVSRAAALQRLQDVLDVVVEPVRAGLSWAELRLLQQDGVVIGPHSRTHALLDQVDWTTLHDEIFGSRDDLVRELGRCAPVFAYPNGNFDARTVKVVRDAGLAAACTTAPGLNRLSPPDAFRLRRSDARVSWRRFVLNLSTPVALLRGLRHPLSASDGSRAHQ
jgi:peptidoglycan/xylan/chitin deacetylase (PgdA/CDA1 family)